MELVVDTNALSAWLDGDPGIAEPLAGASKLRHLYCALCLFC